MMMMMTKLSQVKSLDEFLPFKYYMEEILILRFVFGVTNKQLVDLSPQTILFVL